MENKESTQSPVTYTIGGYKIARSAFFILVTGLLYVIARVYMMGKFNNGLVIALFFVLLSTYSNHCMNVGMCTIYSNISSFIVTIGYLSLIYLTYNRDAIIESMKGYRNISI